MSDYENVTERGGTHLTEQECWDLLGQSRLGRLVVMSDGRPEIFPVNYAVAERKVYLRTAEGGKLAAMTVEPLVAFEADHADEDTAWSVVGHGTARLVTAFSESAKLDELGVVPWEPTDKFNYVELSFDEVHGRRFERRQA